MSNLLQCGPGPCGGPVFTLTNIVSRRLPEPWHCLDEPSGFEVSETAGMSVFSRRPAHGPPAVLPSVKRVLRHGLRPQDALPSEKPHAFPPGETAARFLLPSPHRAPRTSGGKTSRFSSCPRPESGTRGLAFPGQRVPKKGCREIQPSIPADAESRSLRGEGFPPCQDTGTIGRKKERPPGRLAARGTSPGLNKKHALSDAPTAAAMSPKGKTE